MNSAIERLLTLRVSDVMNSPVASLAESATMAEAAKLFADRGITGAPVVNAGGHCVGILSATDFAMRENRLSGGNEELSFAWNHAVTRVGEESPLCIEPIAEDRVGDYMSPVVQTINQTASLVNASRVMCQEHIHRLVIIDEDERPVGVVSSLDLVAAMVAAMEE